jgi:hypothetical protein
MPFSDFYRHGPTFGTVRALSVFRRGKVLRWVPLTGRGEPMAE